MTLWNFFNIILAFAFMAAGIVWCATGVIERIRDHIDTIIDVINR
jgi:hypothetical protein